MPKISQYTQVQSVNSNDKILLNQTVGAETDTYSASIEQVGDNIAGTQQHADLKTDNQTIIGGINELAKNKNVTDEYDDTHTYNKGDVTIYGNTLYICQNNSVTGTFDPSKWTATTIDNVIGSLSTLTTTDKSSLVGAVNEVDEFISHLSNKYVIGGTKSASGITRVDFGMTFSSPPVVSVIPLNSTSPQTYLRTCALVTLTSTYFEFVEIAIQNNSSTLINGTDNCVWIAAGNKA